MWILIAAVATASLMGSMHCVGMCGPLALWAAGAGSSLNRSQLATASSLYHIGRLMSYAIVGAFAGSLGGLVDMGGELLGGQLLAARIVGGLMIVFGARELWKVAASSRPRPAASSVSQPDWITRQLLRARPFVFGLPIPARGLMTGLFTAFLPCGWLYLFALVAAGSGSWLSGVVVMSAFWIGTVPALVSLLLGTQAMAIRFRKLVPAVVAILMIVGGCYTAAGRGFANLNSLTDIRTNSRLAGDQAVDSSHGGPLDLDAEMDKLVHTSLPCCEPAAEKAATDPSPR